MKILSGLLAVMVVSVLVARPAVAQSSETTCPVNITDVRNLDNRIFVLFTNVSGKRLDSYQFALEFFDLNGASHKYPEKFKALAHVKDRSRFVAYWKSTHTLQFLFPRAHAYLESATFSDGSTWTDDGDHACGISSEQE